MPYSEQASETKNNLNLLVKPEIKYQASYLQAIEEMVRIGESNYVRPWDSLSDEHYFLVDGEKYLGLLELRLQPTGKYKGLESHIHYSIAPTERGKGYGTEILRLGLDKARGLDLEKVILTCKENNLGSSRVIEANGGKLLEKVEVKGDRGDTMAINKYEINLK